MNQNTELDALAGNPSTPFWARVIIRDCLDRDCVDVANVLALVAQAFERRARKILGQEVGDPHLNIMHDPGLCPDCTRRAGFKVTP